MNYWEVSYEERIESRTKSYEDTCVDNNKKRG